MFVLPVLAVLCGLCYSSALASSNSSLGVGNSYDSNLVNLALYHSESAYCDPDSYLTRTFKAPLDGFKATYKIYQNTHDVNGYIGYSSSDKQIVVTYRGSESIENWISDLDAVITDYPLCSSCQVHKGFYVAEQSVIADVTAQVKSLVSSYPSYTVLITGHSLGAAMATLTAADLKEAGVGNIKLINFGSPRIGNTEFAEWYSSYITYRNRVTHHKDIVPHCPMHERFTHISGEWYEPDETVPVYVNECTGLEDPNCSYQWHVTSVDDHLWYLNLNLGAGGDNCKAFL